jgi:hypothetical protein
VQNASLPGHWRCSPARIDVLCFERDLTPFQAAGEGRMAPPAGRREIVRSLALPDVRERLDAIGFVPVANTPDEFAAVIKAESERWSKVIRATNIKAEP